MSDSLLEPSRVGTRMRGFLKGIRYISQMFEDEEQEIQIGLPTDVKHVAHIGWDGPSVESPSWMKEFTTKPEASHSAPLDRSGNPIENPELKWGSQDLSSISNSLARELPDLPKSSRRNSTDNSVPTECDGESCPRPRRTRDPNKPRSSRRHQRKESSEGGGSASEDQNNADLETSTSKKTHRGGPKKPRRRKPNENKATSIPPVAYTSPFSDPGPGSNTDNLEQ